MKPLNLLVLIVLSAGCAKNDGASNADLNNAAIGTKANTTQHISYLALGDSYTIGEAEPSDESFPYQLNAILSNAGFYVDTPKIVAGTGWTTDDLIASLAARNISTIKFDFITLLIGVNDQYQGLSQANYKIKFKEILNTAIGLASGDSSRVFVMSVPDYGVTPFANGDDAKIGPQIDMFNSVNKEISYAAGVHYVDITSISREAGTNNMLLASDGLHPSGQMYKLWVNLLEPLVAARLNKQ